MGVDDVHANASSLSCFSCCFVFLCIGAKGGMGAFRIGFCGVFLKFPGSTVPSVQGWGGGMAAGGGEGEGLMTSMRMRLTCAVSRSALCIGGEGGDVDDVDVVLHDVDCLCGR